MIGEAIRRLSPNDDAEQVDDLPHPAPYVPGRFSNEVDMNDKKFVSRYQSIVQLPDGIKAGQDPEHELWSVQHQLKIVSVHLLILLTFADDEPVRVLRHGCSRIRSRCLLAL
jgi:hypothetical protein